MDSVHLREISEVRKVSVLSEPVSSGWCLCFAWFTRSSKKGKRNQAKQKKQETNKKLTAAANGEIPTVHQWKYTLIDHLDLI